MWNPYADLGARQRRVLALVSIVTVLGGWALVSGLGLVTPLKLPAPWSVARAFSRLAWDAETGQSPLLNHTQWSVMRVIVAGGLVVAIGLPTGILMGASPRINAILSPLVDPFRSAPVVALLPILVMWLGIGESMKVAFLFVGAVVFLVPMVRDAVVAVPQEHWISARDLGATPWEAVWHAVVPMAKPRIADAITVSVSIMWTYITVAEYVNAKEGIGALIQHAKRFSAMDQVFVGIAVIMGLALVTNAGLTAIKRRLYPWEAEG
jgi:ABC-type nitrate/sulfonate/bicarbonate transport system permease component